MTNSLITRLALALSLFFAPGVFSQNYTWLRGLSTGTTLGVFGTQGTPSAANDPGSRHGAATWTDAQGNLWLFGGEGILANSQWWADLWKYNPTTNQWTWMKGPNTPNVAGVYGTQGVSSPNNNPGSREFPMSWTDAQGNFWLFGGDGQGSTYMAPPMNKLADLWKYNPTTNEWTWMSGSPALNPVGVFGTQNVPAPTNNPGGRYWGATWVDNSGKFWLFGGRGLGAAANTVGKLNDLWSYDPATGSWTWVGGSQNISTSGIYGTMGVGSAANWPGGREWPNAWLSATGNLIMHGGSGFNNVANLGCLNDMWEYNIGTGIWTWINGTTAVNPTGVYGTLGVPSALTLPGGRYSSACWTDPMGCYWMLGGAGCGTVTNVISELNDLFKYNPATGQWTWIKGATVVNQTGVYGTQGVAAPANTPGARSFNTWWRGAANTGYLYFMGGVGYSSNAAQYESMNDLWKFQIPCNPDSAKTVPLTAICSGNSASLTAYNVFPSPVSWYTTPTGGTAVGSGSVFNTPQLTAQGTSSVYTYYAEANSCSLTPRAMTTITVLALPQLSVTGPASLCPAQQTVTLTVSGAQSYSWSTGSNATSISFAASAPVNGAVTGLAQNGCQNSVTYSVGLYALPAISAHTAKSLICENESVVLTATGGSSYVWNGTTNNQTVTVTPSVSTTYTVVGTDVNGCSNTYTFTQFVVSCTGIETLAGASMEVSVYPNPGNGVFNIALPASARLVVSSQLGAVVLEQELNPGNNVINAGLGKGLYLYTILLPGEVNYKGKIVIE